MADDDVVVDDEATVVAESPSDRLRRREGSPAPEPLVIEGEGLTPEAALAQVHKTLTTRDQELATARQAAIEAQNQAAQARQQAQQAQAARMQDATTTVAAMVESANAERARAKQAIRAAREAGDLDAEEKAQDEFQAASYRFHQANGELQRVKANPAPAQQSQGGYTPAAQQWIARNPRFNSDPNFKAVAIGADQTARDNRIVPDSPEYFAHLDRTIAAVFPGQQQGAAPVENERRTSTAARPSSEGPTGGGRPSQMVDTPLGPIRVTRRSDGKLGIQLPPGKLPEFEEWAAINKMTVAAYAQEFARIAEERASGGDAGWTDATGGRVWK